MGEAAIYRKPIVDAHHHFWDIARNYHPWLTEEPMIPFRYGDYSSIRRNYLPPEYFKDAGELNIAKTVYVETEWDPEDPIGETRWVHELANETGFPNAVVAQAWLDRSDVDEVLKAQSAFPLVRSVRHKPATKSRQDARVRGDSGSMDDDGWKDGYSKLLKYDLRFDLQTPWWHLDQARDLARDFPDTTIILNHTGLPAERDKESLHAWLAAMASFSECSNVCVKVSGICQPGVPWSAETNGWIVRETIAMFGIDRTMFASNFPVDGVCDSFQSIYAGFTSIVSDLEDADQQRLFYDNAMRIYAID